MFTVHHNQIQKKYQNWFNYKMRLVEDDDGIKYELYRNISVDFIEVLNIEYGDTWSYSDQTYDFTFSSEENAIRFKLKYC